MTVLNLVDITVQPILFSFVIFQASWFMILEFFKDATALQKIWIISIHHMAMNETVSVMIKDELW